MTKGLEVSVVIPVYNTGEFVLKTIESIEQQTFPNHELEIIVIDDCSTDDSYLLLKEKDFWSENKILLRNSENLGLNATLNIGLRKAKGRFIVFIGDDLMHNRRIEEQVRALNESEDEVAICFTDLTIINDAGETISPSYFKTKYNKNGGDFLVNSPFHELLKSNFIPAPSVMYKKSILVALGGFDESLKFEDYDMNLRLLKEYNCIYIDFPLTAYRITEGALTKSLFDDPSYSKTYFDLYEKHLDTLSELKLLSKVDWFVERIYSYRPDLIDENVRNYVSNYTESKRLKRAEKFKLYGKLFRIYYRITS